MNSWLKRGIIVLVILAVLSLLYAAAYNYSLNKVEVRSVQIGLKDVNATGFRLQGTIEVSNAGIVPVDMRNTRYSVVLDATGQELASGASPGGRIGAGKIRNFPLDADVQWQPSAALAGQLIAGGNTNAEVQGVVDVGSLVQVNIPFTAEVDLGPYVRQSITDAVGRLVDNILGTAEEE